MNHEKSIETYKQFWWETPAGQFRQQVAHYAKSPDYCHFVFYDEFQELCLGGFALTHGNLTFLSDEQNICKSACLKQIYIRPENRGEGLFGAMMESLKMFAEENGVLLHFVAHHFKIDMPVIRNPEEYISWIDKEDINLQMEKNSDKDWHLSKRLYDTYQRMGFCNLTLDHADVHKAKWREMAFCSDPAATPEDVQNAIAGRTNCGEDRQTHTEQMNARNAVRRKQRKRLKKARRQNRSRKAA